MSSINVTIKSKNRINVSLTGLDSTLFLQKSVYDPDVDGAFDAGIIAVNTENFTGNLSSVDDTLQKALETLDQLSAMEGGSTVAEWGSITGTLSNQTDLQSALNSKASTSHTHTGVYEPANSNIQTHINSVSNPHNVTASQIGALTSSSIITDFISGLIESPSNGDYVVLRNAPFAGTITSITTKSSAGTCTLTGYINSTALGGSANSVSASEQEQVHSSNNTFAAGDDIKITVSANSSCKNIEFTIKFTRGLS